MRTEGLDFSRTDVHNKKRKGRKRNRRRKRDRKGLYDFSPRISVLVHRLDIERN